MINTKKILSEIESIVYEDGTSKINADQIISSYVVLFGYTNFKDFRVTVIKNPLKLQIKHKAFNKKIFLYFKDNCLYIENNIVQLEDINKILPSYFEIDKKKEEE